MVARRVLLAWLVLAAFRKGELAFHQAFSLFAVAEHEAVPYVDVEAA